jgi:hypothetical protein
MSNVDKVLDTFGRKVVQTARGILNAKGKNATGDLGSSLGYFIKVYPSGAVDMSFVAEGYAKFVDKGVKGSKSSAKAPNSPYKYRDKKGRFIPRKSLVYSIARNIKLYGVKPSNFFTDAFNVAYRDLPKDFIKAYAQDTQQFLKFVSKEIE